MLMPISHRSAAIASALGALLLIAATAQDPGSPKPTNGHVVLVVEGNVKALRVTRAVAKQDEWGGAPKGLVSEFALVMLNGDGKELQRVPLDLSKFETDESKIDSPVVVKGCEVKSPQIGALLNIPVVDGVATYRFVRGERTIGEVDAASMQRMIEEARR
jgi:hypothetical protein